MSDDRYETGMKVRRAVLGDAHVDRAEAQKTAFDEGFQRFITETAWGGVWARTGLSRRERSMLAIALLAAGGHQDELAMHVRAARNTGASPEDVFETLMQVALYSGIPAANSAIRIAKETYAALDRAEEGAGK